MLVSSSEVFPQICLQSSSTIIQFLPIRTRLHTPGVIFVGHGSDQALHCLLTRISITNNRNENVYMPPLHQDGLLQLLSMV